jgi:CubicO group peptidase (beta-lactamase class C family)
MRYAGGGTTIAQQVVTDVTGLPFEQLMHDLVLAPLGMEHSTYAQPLADRAEHAATAHPAKYQATPGGWHTYPEQAAAGLWTTPSDLGRVGLGVLAALRGERPDWLSAASIRMMLTKQGGSECGIGFFIAGEGDTLRFGHSGGNEGFLSELQVYAQSGSGAAVMINSNDGWPLIGEIMRSIAEVYGWTGFTPPAPVAVVVPDAALDRWVGTYQGEHGFAALVRRSGADLVLEVGAQPPLTLHPSSETSFFLREVNGSVSFTSDAAGGVANLILEQGGQKITATTLLAR